LIQSECAKVSCIFSKNEDCIKKCNRCGERKPHSAFYFRGGNPVSVCKACRAAENKAYREANKESRREKSKTRREEKAAQVTHFGREALLTLEDLKATFHYDPDTGKFTRLTSVGGAHIGDEPGYIHEHGYRIISVRGVKYRAHRLAWFYMTGEWPKEDVDHRNTIPDDNRWENLREATDHQNLQNVGMPKHNTSGLKGANWHKEKQKWRATIQSNGKWRFLGYFKTAEEAHSAYCKAAQELNGEFANFGEAA
jgi:hypothetical protein